MQEWQVVPHIRTGLGAPQWAPITIHRPFTILLPRLQWVAITTTSQPISHRWITLQYWCVNQRVVPRALHRTIIRLPHMVTRSRWVYNIAIMLEVYSEEALWISGVDITPILITYLEVRRVHPRAFITNLWTAIITITVAVDQPLDSHMLLKFITKFQIT
jgi:hypothetical protein